MLYVCYKSAKILQQIVEQKVLVSEDSIQVLPSKVADRAISYLDTFGQFEFLFEDDALMRSKRVECTCPTCNKLINSEDVASCSSCKKWFHFKFENISHISLKILEKKFA